MFEDQKSSLEKNVEVLMTDVAEIKAEQRDLRKDVAKIRAEQCDLRKDVEYLRRDVDDLKKGVDGIRADQNRMGQDLTSFRVDVTRELGNVRMAIEQNKRWMIVVGATMFATVIGAVASVGRIMKLF